MKAPWRLSGYIDAEVQAPRTADRDAVNPAGPRAL